MTTFVRTDTTPTLRAPRLATMVALYRSRRDLATLDRAALADIGVTPTEAQAEARRAFWDMPRAWRALRCC